MVVAGVTKDHHEAMAQLLAYCQALSNELLGDATPPERRQDGHRGQAHAIDRAEDAHRAEGDMADDLALLHCDQGDTKAPGRPKRVNQARLVDGRE